MSPFAVFGFLLISVIICTALAGMVTAWTWAIGRFWAGQPLLPTTKPRPVPWGVGSVLAVIVVWVVVNLAVSVAYLGLTGSLRAGRKPTLTEQMTVVSLINGVLLVVIPMTLRLTARARLSPFGLEPRGLAREGLVGTVGFLLAAPLVYTVNVLCVQVWSQHKHKLEEMVMAEPNAGVAFLAFVSAVVLAPAAEELLFRGIVQSWLVQLWRQGHARDDAIDDTGADWSASTALPTTEECQAGAVSEAVTPVAVEGELFSGQWTAPASEQAVGQDKPFFADDPERRSWVVSRRESRAPVLITSALFAVVHLPQWPAPIAIFVLSVGLGVVYQRTGSLFASFVMHALFNGFSTLILFQAVLIGAPADPKVVPTATCMRPASPVPVLLKARAFIAPPSRR